MRPSAARTMLTRNAEAHDLFAVRQEDEARGLRNEAAAERDAARQTWLKGSAEECERQALINRDKASAIRRALFRS